MTSHKLGDFLTPLWHTKLSVYLGLHTLCHKSVNPLSPYLWDVICEPPYLCDVIHEQPQMRLQVLLKIISFHQTTNQFQSLLVDCLSKP